MRRSLPTNEVFVTYGSSCVCSTYGARIVPRGEASVGTVGAVRECLGGEPQPGARGRALVLAPRQAHEQQRVVEARGGDRGRVGDRWRTRGG